MKLLTIIVPTYNRSEKLALLLRSLLGDLKNFEDSIQLIVGDNASSDNTQQVLSDFKNIYPSAIILRHRVNLGPDENFCRCVEKVSTRYFWIIGDDDLPKHGIVAQVLVRLAETDIDLMYLNSEWRVSFKDAGAGEPVGVLNYAKLSQREFAEEVNVWITYISGMIVNKERLFELNPNLDIRRFQGTSLVQLGWVLPIFMAGRYFITCSQRCVLATGNNSGGYELFKVFCINFLTIVGEVCGGNSHINRVIRRKLEWEFIPRLIIGTRFRKVGAFPEEDILQNLNLFKGSLAYNFFLIPLIRLPKLPAYAVYLILMIPLMWERFLLKFKNYFF